MKYRIEVEINESINNVIKLFENPENLKHWQPGFQSLEHISGTIGKPGAKSKLVYKEGKRKFEMIETIVVNKLPDEFTSTYDVKELFTTIKNKFETISENKTRYISEQEIQFKGYMKIIGFLMSGSFKKSSMKYLTQFKEFVENK